MWITNAINSFIFQVSLSTEAYSDKIISNAMIGSSKNEDNRRIRKKYGFPPNKGISFVKKDVTSGELLAYLLKGHVFCHLFTPKRTLKDGSFSKTEKNNENFYGSYVIGVDIDDTKYESAESFVEKLSLKPTFYYTSYSNMKDNKGARFRLIYVFDRMMKNPYFFRYCAYSLNTVIEHDTGEKIKDKCNLNCSQYFNGTNKDAPVNLSYGSSDYIYSLEDIITPDGFIPYLISCCNYKSVDNKMVKDIEGLLEKFTGKSYSLNRSKMVFVENSSELIQTDTVNEEKLSLEHAKCSQYLIKVLNSYNFDKLDTFMKYNRHRYHLIYRKEKDEWIDNIYQFVDDDYFALHYNYNKVKDGHKRRKKLYERMCLRRILEPGVDADTLLFNAYVDVCKFFEVDKDLTVDCLVRNVERAMSLETKDIMNNFKDDIERLKSKRPRSGIIIKRGICHGTVETNRKLKEIRWSLIADYFDPELPIKDNLLVIKECLFEIGKSTLYEFCKQNNIKTKGKKNSLTDDELLPLIDTRLTVRQNLAILKDSDISIGNNRLSRLLKLKKNNSFLDLEKKDSSVFSTQHQSNNTVTSFLNLEQKDKSSFSLQHPQKTITSFLEMEQKDRLQSNKEEVDNKSFVDLESEDKDSTIIFLTDAHRSDTVSKSSNYKQVYDTNLSSEILLGNEDDWYTRTTDTINSLSRTPKKEKASPLSDDWYTKVLNYMKIL